MRIKMLSTVLLTVLLSVSVKAGFEQFNDPVGGMNVFNSGGAYQYSIVPFGMPDLQSITADNRTFELIPNVNLYADNPGSAEWRNNSGAGPDGNKILEANTLFEINAITADMNLVTFNFTVDAFDLDPRYELRAFVKVLDSVGGTYNALTFQEVIITGTGPQPQLQISALGQTGQLLQAGWTLRGLNANPADDWGSAIVTATSLDVTSIDFAAPTPDPMVFEVAPYALSDWKISMTASNATDNYHAVEYLFTNTVNNTSSGWQSSPTWVDAGPIGGVSTTELALVNADFEAGGSGWTFDSNIGWGDPSGASTTNISGNEAALAYVNGSEDNGNGGYAVVVQAVTPLAGTDFSGGDTVTLSSDIRALAGLNGGGAILKMESWSGGANMGADLEVPIPGTTESWANYSMDYTIAAGADEIRIVVGTSTGWGGQNATDSYYLFDNVVVSKEVNIPTGLSFNTMYTYMVKARDMSANANETAWSTAASASTNPEDNASPQPGTMTFDATDASPATVKLTATTASDDSSVEYYFTCTSGGGNDSGWQSSPIYYDTGLVPGSTYSYTVIARDTSFAMNSNAVSAVTNVTTMTVASSAFNDSLTGYTGNTGDAELLFQLEKNGLTTGSENSAATIDLGAAGATFGDGVGAAGRNLLKTIASGYQGASFEVYATLTFSGASDLSGFIGLGQGLQTGIPDNYGVPELNLGGVNGVVAQFKDGTAASGTFNCELFKFVGGNPGSEVGGTNILSAPIGSTETIRARLIYDAAAETVNVAFDKNYTGGAFVADQDMGTVSTSLTDTNAVDYSMWDGAPVRVYVGGGEGTIVKDFEIVVTREAQAPFDVQVAGVVAGGGLALSWDGTSGYTYALQYTTNLVTGPWMFDPSPGATNIISVGGTESATSTVNNASVFYQIISE